MEYFADTDIGNYREKNEDYFYANGNLFVVADGMGGHRAGEIASRLAVETFTKDFNQSLANANITKNASSDNTSTDKKTKNITHRKIKELLITSVKNSNNEVFKKAVLQPEYYGMGTTLTGCYIHKDKAYIIHIGDSRLYIKRGSKLKLITSDHTIVGELYRRGEISYEATFNHPQRNYLTNVIGVAEDIEPDFRSCKILEGDIIIICSDGLNSMLRDEHIKEIIDNYNEKIKDIVKNLIKEALKKDGLDNITVIAIKI